MHLFPPCTDWLNYRYFRERACVSFARLMRGTLGWTMVRCSSGAAKAANRGISRHIVLNNEGVKFRWTFVSGRLLDESLFRKSGGSRQKLDHQFRPFKQTIANKQIDPEVTFDQLHHTWASLTILANAPLIANAPNLGHLVTAIVEAYHGHFAPKATIWNAALTPGLSCRVPAALTDAVVGALLCFQEEVLTGRQHESELDWLTPRRSRSIT